MKRITSRSQPRRQPRILEQQAAGTVVLLTLDGGRYYALEGAGGRAWELCDGLRSLLEIARLMSNEYDALPGDIIGDLIALFTDLANEDLVGENR